jgi:hypothetical protein
LFKNIFSDQMRSEHERDVTENGPKPEPVGMSLLNLLNKNFQETEEEKRQTEGKDKKDGQERTNTLKKLEKTWKGGANRYGSLNDLPLRNERKLSVEKSKKSE